MIKYFCDRCETEIPYSQNAVRNRITATSGRFQVEVMVAVDKTWNAGVLCSPCLISIINQAHDESRANV